jgi:signal transduction histidine kinase
MTRRLLPTLVVLGAGLAALSAFLVALELVFVDEREQGAREAAWREEAVRQYAQATFVRAVEDAERSAEGRLEAVRADPLLDATGLVFVADGVQELPPLEPPPSVATLEPRFQELSTKPETIPSSDESPVTERVRLLAQARAALAARAPKPIETSVRAFLEHRSRFLLAPQDDLPTVLSLLDALLSEAHPSPDLLRLVLVDGVGGATPVEGLQRSLLRGLGRLGSVDRHWACDTVAALSRRAGLSSAAFEARCRERTSRAEPAPPFQGLEPGRWLVRRGDEAWAVSVGGGTVRGLALSEAAFLTVITAQLQQQGLLEPEARLSVAAKGERVAWKDLRVGLSSSRSLAAEAARTRAFHLKSALVVVCLALGFAIAAAAVVAQRRKLALVEMKSDFVSTVSHELRTPLAGLRLMAETLERKLEGRDELKDWPRRLVREVDGLSFLVENLLSFNRLDKGRWTPRPRPLALEELRPALEEEAQAYGAAKVSLELQGFDARLSADPELLTILFRNLVRNACRYNERDPVVVRLAARADGSGVTVEVSDNGVGIPKGSWESAFEAFERLRSERGRGGGGSGLGLALCRRIARLHQGDVRILASSEQGTTFEVRLSGATG